MHNPIFSLLGLLHLISKENRDFAFVQLRIIITIISFPPAISSCVKVKNSIKTKKIGTQVDKQDPQF